MPDFPIPFTIPERPPVTRVRQTDPRLLRAPRGERTQPMAGFDAQYTDIVDYIVRITEEIWTDRNIGRIYDTYDHACSVYSQYGVVRSVEEVVASTTATLHAHPDGEAHYLAVAWDGDERDFYTSHLGFSRSTNVGPSAYGPGTGRRVQLRFCADCVSRDNRIHTEWLVRDNGALVRQLGHDLHDAARAIAERPTLEVAAVAPPTRLEGQAPRRAYQGPRDTPARYMAHHFHDIWNMRGIHHVREHYTDDVVAHWPGGRTAVGCRALGSLIIGILASIPDGVLRIEHVCHAEEVDGVIVATRWLLEGTTRPGGLLGDVPAGRAVSMMGMTHMRFTGAKIAEEWTLFDEVGVLAQAYRG